FNFVLFLSLYLLFAIGALSSSEIRRAAKSAPATARSSSRQIGLRLALLAAWVTCGILIMTAGLFFILPRTPEAAFSRLIPRRMYLPGLSNQITLGDIGELKASSRPVMHIRVYSARPLGGLKWRGGIMTDFDGRRWSNPVRRLVPIPLENGSAALVPAGARPPVGARFNYHVDLEAL